MAYIQNSILFIVDIAPVALGIAGFFIGQHRAKLLIINDELKMYCDELQEQDLAFIDSIEYAEQIQHAILTPEEELMRLQTKYFAI